MASAQCFKCYTVYVYIVSQVTKLQVTENRRTIRVEMQVARMVVVMVIAFLLTWLPYAAFALSVMIDPSLYIDPLIATAPMYLAKCSTVYNPIIYIFMNRQVCPQSLKPEGLNTHYLQQASD